MGVQTGCAPEGLRSREGRGEGGSEGVGAQFSPLPLQHVACLFSHSGALLVECWWCLKCRGPQKSTFGVLSAILWGPSGPVWLRAPGFHKMDPHVQLGDPRPSQTPPRSTRTSRKEKKKERSSGRCNSGRSKESGSRGSGERRCRAQKRDFPQEDSHGKPEEHTVIQNRFEQVTVSSKVCVIQNTFVQNAFIRRRTLSSKTRSSKCQV